MNQCFISYFQIIKALIGISAMNDITTTATKPALPSTSKLPVPAKAETAKPAGLPVLNITKLAKDASLDIESVGTTTAIKLDNKFRIEVTGNVKLNIK
jgi:hypothetical protein